MYVRRNLCNTSNDYRTKISVINKTKKITFLHFTTIQGFPTLMSSPKRKIYIFVFLPKHYSQNTDVADTKKKKNVYQIPTCATLLYILLNILAWRLSNPHCLHFRTFGNCPFSVCFRMQCWSSNFTWVITTSFSCQKWSH